MCGILPRHYALILYSKCMRHTPESTVALVMNKEGLLTMRRPDEDENYIDLPGGEIGLYEQPHQAITRQLKDDLGLTVRTWKEEGHIDVRSPHGLATVHIVRAAVDEDDLHCIESSTAYRDIHRLDPIHLRYGQRTGQYELSPNLTRLMTLMTNGEVQRAADPIAVALITNEYGEILVGQRRDEGHHLQEFELPGGRIKNPKRPDLTVEERVRKETGVYAQIQERCTTLFFEDDGETREAQLWNAELTSGRGPSAKEPAVHGGFGYRSLNELKRKGVHLSPLLHEFADMAIRNALELKIGERGQRIWHKSTASGITEVS